MIEVTKTLAKEMRDLAFNNKIVKELYNEAIEEIKSCAKEGELVAIVGNDETVKELLLLDGFIISEIDNNAFIKVSW